LHAPYGHKGGHIPLKCLSHVASVFLNGFFDDKGGQGEGSCAKGEAGDDRVVAQEAQAGRGQGGGCVVQLEKAGRRTDFFFCLQDLTLLPPGVAAQHVEEKAESGGD